MRTEAETRRALALYADAVRRVCFLYMKNPGDAEDVFQEVFLKYALSPRDFQSDDHERAWLLRVAINACKDVLKSFWRRRVSSLEALGSDYPAPPARDREVLDAVLELPVSYRDVVYLHYFEGYKAVEIAAILNKKENTVYSRLARARDMLREKLGGEPDAN